jgi:hypothetical protein
MTTLIKKLTALAFAAQVFSVNSHASVFSGTTSLAGQTATVHLTGTFGNLVLDVGQGSTLTSMITLNESDTTLTYSSATYSISSSLPISTTLTSGFGPGLAVLGNINFTTTLQLTDTIHIGLTPTFGGNFQVNTADFIASKPSWIAVTVGTYTLNTALGNASGSFTVPTGFWNRGFATDHLILGTADYPNTASLSVEQNYGGIATWVVSDQDVSLFSTTVGGRPVTLGIGYIGLESPRNLSFSSTPVPEPSAAVFLSLGTLGWLGKRRRLGCLNGAKTPENVPSDLGKSPAVG